jgi:hypothetical protein
MTPVECIARLCALVPPPRDRSGPIIPDALLISATLLARQIDGAEVSASNVLSAKHLNRIHGGLLFAATSSVPWALLPAKTCDVNKKALPSMRRTPRLARRHHRSFGRS